MIISCDIRCFFYLSFLLHAISPAFNVFFLVLFPKFLKLFDRYGFQKKMVADRKETKQLQWCSVEMHPSVLWISWHMCRLMSRTAIPHIRHVFICAHRVRREWKWTSGCHPRNVIPNCSLKHVRNWRERQTVLKLINNR